MSMSIAVAKEHVDDGVDCINDAMKVLKRLKKNFPSTVTSLTEAEVLLMEARSKIKDSAQFIA